MNPEKLFGRTFSREMFSMVKYIAGKESSDVGLSAILCYAL